MDLRSIWFKRGEHSKLIDAIEGNKKDEAFDIIHEMKKRGDL